MKGLTINKKFLLTGVFPNIQLAEKEEEKKIKITIKRKSKTREKNQKKKERIPDSEEDFVMKIKLVAIVWQTRPGEDDYSTAL